MTHIDKTPYRYDLLLMVQDGSFNARASPLHNYNHHLHTPHGKDLETAGSGLPAIAAIAGSAYPTTTGLVYLGIAGSAHPDIAAIAGFVSGGCLC